jgi:dynein heavy chain
LVIKYINKCFEGINSLEFKNSDEIISVISEEGEKIFLFKPINVNEGDKKGSVEKWLSELEEVMRNTMQIKV